MLIAGVDEAGRGPLAGPVFSAAVILDPLRRINGLKDSKLLTAEKRESLFEIIINKAVAFAIGKATVEEIDKLNILQATFLSMRRAIENLLIKPDEVYVDGNQDPKLNYPTTMIIGGDNSVKAISAASILAKVARDREMMLLDKEFPGYGFAKHKGYGTGEHLTAIRKLGPCQIHRQSFSPIKDFYKENQKASLLTANLLETIEDH